MITDPSAFRDEPARELMHREHAVETLLRAWGPTLHGEAGDEVLISGSSGVGKTSLAKHTIDRLDSETDVEATYVECLGATSKMVLGSVLQQHSSGSVPTGDPSVPELTQQLREAVDEPTIVILDEAEGLPSSEALDRLADISHLSTVVVCHDPHRWQSRLTTDAVSERYLDATHIRLDRFSVGELADILQARARAGLPSSVVTRTQLEEIADEVAGVARDGIQSLRAAAEHAEERGAWKIEQEDIDACYEIAQQRIRELNLRSLTIHHQALYALIHGAGEIRGEDLHERYDALAERIYRDTTRTPIVRRTRRDRLRKLEEYDLIEREGTSAPAYSPVNPSIQPPIDIYTSRDQTDTLPHR